MNFQHEKATRLVHIIFSKQKSNRKLVCPKMLPANFGVCKKWNSSIRT